MWEDETIKDPSRIGISSALGVRNALAHLQTKESWCDWPEVREVESDMRETAKSGKVALLLVRI